MEIIKEASSKIYAEPRETVDSKMPVFYNPVMQLNRDFSILVLASLDHKDMKIADPLAGSGIRSIRIMKEVNQEKIDKIFVNDVKKEYEEYFRKNLELNGIGEEKFVITNHDANLVLSSLKLDYVDIDPFGTPNPFLDSAVRSLKKNGVLAITATDTSTLCGSYPQACKRKYWAKPLRNELMHEFGLRILIRKVQLVGVQHEKALLPIFSYSKHHYMRIFFICINEKKICDEIIMQHKFYSHNKEIYGPIWIGRLWDKLFVNKMLEVSKNIKGLTKQTLKLLETINEEKEIDTFGFIDMHASAKGKLKGNLPKIEKVIAELASLGYEASRTHFTPKGIRTNAPVEEYEKVIKKIIR